MINQPIATNPVVDTTGANAGAGDQGAVFFLAGSTSPGPVTRTITVPADKPLFTPLINIVVDNTNVPGQPPTNFTAAQLLALADPLFTPTAVSVFAEIDGVAQTGLLNHRRTTDAASPFSYTTTSPDNLIDAVFGGDSTLGTGVYPSTVSPVVQDGYWIAVEPFAAGSTHTLHFGGTNGGGFTQDITYVITTVPEPAAAGLLLAPLVFAFARGRRRALKT